MVVTDLEDIENQIPMTPALKKAIHFLRVRSADILHMRDGAFDIDGNTVFAIIQRYQTVKTDSPRFECHRKFIDLQYVASGEEIIGWTPARQMTITEPYDEDRDICFGTMAKGEWSYIYLRAGQLAIFLPEDAHAPKIAAGEPSTVMKVVVKLAVQQ